MSALYVSMCVRQCAVHCVFFVCPCKFCSELIASMHMVFVYNLCKTIRGYLYACKCMYVLCVLVSVCVLCSLSFCRSGTIQIALSRSSCSISSNASIAS